MTDEIYVPPTISIVLPRPEHEHEFTIPVEWRTDQTETLYKSDWSILREVTKLRCVCGEEVER